MDIVLQTVLYAFLFLSGILCFYGELTKIILEWSSPNTFLIYCSTKSHINRPEMILNASTGVSPINISGFNFSCNWAAAWQNQQNDLCIQRRLRSAWATTQSDQSLHCPHEESLGPYLPTEHTAKTLIKLGGCPGWSESSLGMQVILLGLSCCGSYLHISKVRQQRNFDITPYTVMILSFLDLL